jgi:alpha-beta hydrolase superfamily lysophospholipase
VIALFEIFLRRQFCHLALGSHKYSIAVLGAATLCFWWVSPSMAAPVGALSLDRFESSGIAPVQWLAADGRDLSFAQYALQTRDAIARHRWFPADASDERRRLEVDLVSPHQWDPAPGCEPTGTEGILLIHGLSDSPYLLRDLGTALAAQGSCRLIRSILVPGHATRPGDLLHVKYTEWIAAVQYGIRSFVGGAREVHLIGYSTGGALAVLAASDRQAPRPLPVRSLILISPAIRARGLPSGLVITPRVMSGVSATTGAFRWLERHEDLDFAKYESFPLNAWFQLVLLDERVAAATRSTLGVPLLGYVSWDDATTDAAASLRFFRRAADERSRLSITARDSEVPAVTQLAADARISVRGASVAERGVVSYSHLSFGIPEANTHYGLAGDYANCVWYPVKGGRGSAKYCNCLTAAMHDSACPDHEPASGDALRYGEANPTDQRQYVLRRLTFNPRFDTDVRAIGDFIDAASHR